MEIAQTITAALVTLSLIAMSGIAYGTAFQSEGWKRPALAFLGAALGALAVYFFVQSIIQIINT